MAAIREAVLSNHLRWTYIESILHRYEREGFTPPRRERTKLKAGNELAKAWGVYREEPRNGTGKPDLSGIKIIDGSDDEEPDNGNGGQAELSEKEAEIA